MGGINQYLVDIDDQACSSINVTFTDKGDIVAKDNDFISECPKVLMQCYTLDQHAEIEGWIKTAIEQYNTL